MFVTISASNIAIIGTGILCVIAVLLMMSLAYVNNEIQSLKDNKVVSIYWSILVSLVTTFCVLSVLMGVGISMYLN